MGNSLLVIHRRPSSNIPTGLKLGLNLGRMGGDGKADALLLTPGITRGIL
jgi:hypothetical protein